MNGPEENSSLYLPRISVFREVKPTLIKLSKVIVKTQEHAWVIFLKIGEGGRGGARLCYRLLRASREFTEMANVLTDLSRHKKLPKNLLVYLKLALLRYAHERIRVLISYDLRKFRHLYDKHFIPSHKHTQNHTQLFLSWQESARYFAVHFAVAGSKGVFE